MHNFTLSNPGLLAVGIALSATIFVIDSLTPLGVAGGVPHVVPVLIGMWIAWRPAIFILAVLGSLLTILGFYTSPEGGEYWQVLSNRGLAIAAVWVVTLLVDYRRRYDELHSGRERALGSAIVQSVGVLVIVLDPDGFITRCNRTCEKITGRSQSELQGLHILELVDRHEQLDQPGEAFDFPALARRPSRCETFIQSPDMGQRRISWSNTPHFGTAGAIDFLVVAGIDITEQYYARESLRKSEELHRNVVENQIDLIARSLPDGTLTFVNDIYCAFFGKTREELIGRKFCELVHPDYLELVMNRIQQRSAVPTTNNSEWKMVDGAGEVRWLQWTSKPITDVHGGLLEYQTVGRDVTERRSVEEALRESEERHRQLASISPFAIIVHTEGRIVFANPASVELYGASSADDLIGRDALELVHPEDRAQVLEYRKAVSQTRDMRSKLGTVRRLRLDGSEFLGEGAGAGFRWGGKDAHLFVIQDVTALRQAEEELRKAKEAAEQADATKSRFLAAASHDLRQPLYAMSLFLTTLMERFSDPAYTDLLVKMEQSLDSANNLLNTVLDISKLDAGVVKTEISTFRVQAILDQIEVEYSSAAGAANNALTVMPCRAYVRSDRVLLESILRNLVSNAVRYTRGGRILVGCRQRGDRLQVIVRDTGPGIPADKQSAIFNEFERLDDLPGAGNRGLGLGLAIVKRTAVLLGCDVMLTSEVGKGSEFSLEVPLEKMEHAVMPSPAVLPAPLSPDFRGAIIALIEDDPGIRLAIPACLSRWGCNCITAESIDAAIDSLSEANVKPDVLMVDFHLAHGITGLDAIRAVRSRFGQDIPAVIVTADMSPETSRLAREEGIPLLIKPVRPAKLRALLHYLLPAAGESPPLSKTGT